MTGREYAVQTAERLKEFDKAVKRVKSLFVARYGEVLTAEMIAAARQDII